MATRGIRGSCSCGPSGGESNPRPQGAPDRAGRARGPAYGRGMTTPRLLPDLAVWSATSSPTDVAIGLLTATLTLLAGYLVAVTGLYAVALLARAPRAAERVGALTPATLRRGAERAVAALLLSATWLAPAGAAADGRGALPPGLRVPPPAAAGTGEPASALPEDTGRAEVVVQPGDHLWAIAARSLAEARAGCAGGDELVGYWRAVVDANEARLRSGDADLVFPGEAVHLPPPPDGPGCGCG